MAKKRKTKGRRSSNSFSIGLYGLSILLEPVITQGSQGKPSYEAEQGNWGRCIDALGANLRTQAGQIFAKGVMMGLAKKMFGNPTIFALGPVKVKAL